MVRKIIFSLSLMLMAGALLAQQKPQFNPTFYKDPQSGKLYWNRHLPAYLFIAPTPNPDSSIQLQSHKTKQYAEPFYFDSEGINYIRTRWAVDKKTKKTVPNVEILWEVYADGTPPKTQIHLIDPNKTWVNDTLYCSPKLKITLTASDALSGVKTIFYSINGQPFVEYSDTIRVTKPGHYTIKFFSVDNVNNVEQTRQISFVADFFPPITKAVITGIHLGKDENIVSLSTNIFLQAQDKTSGVKSTFYRLDSMKWVKYVNKTKIPLSILKDGRHTLQFYSVDNVNNTEKVQNFNFYLDRTAPITIADVLGDKFVVNNKVYFSGRTKLKLTAVDNKSGVKAVYYSIDGGEFKPYTDPFYLPSVPGWHVVKYFAVDSTENVTIDKINQHYYEYRMKVDKIYMDLTGPKLSYAIIGDKYTRSDTVFISPRTKIALYAQDPESGVKSISYFIDNQKQEIKYTEPFTLADLPSGPHKITIVGYDNVNNRNIKTFEVFLDKKPPMIVHNFDIKPVSVKDSLPVYLPRTKLFFSFIDDFTGTGMIYYSYNGSPLRLYKSYITGFAKGINTVRVEVYDKVGNKATKVVRFYVK